MKVIYSASHKNHAPEKGFSLGKIIECFEKPSRAEFVLEEINRRQLAAVLPPQSFAQEKILRIHDGGYVDFLKTAWREWAAEGFEGNATASVFNQHKNAAPPGHIDGKLGYYFADTIVSLTPTSWDAIEQSAFTALTAQEGISGGDRAAFALCRPPGHHATADRAAGYCFLNNAAIAAQGFLDSGCSKVAILDVDYHHGNGTQDIFYHRKDVLCVSIHADPRVEYPYFLGHESETGSDEGEGYNRNYPLPLGTGWTSYETALVEALKTVERFGADILIVSLGVDTFESDPISQFKLKSDDFSRLGKSLSAFKNPVLFVMEGGYATQAIGTNVANVLEGFLS